MPSDGEDEQSDTASEEDEEYDDEPADDEDEMMEDDDDDSDFGGGPKKKSSKSKAPKPPKEPSALKKKRESTQEVKLISASASFPQRRERSESSDEDYASKSHKKKSIQYSARDTPDSGFADAQDVWRRGAAKKVVTYDEAQANYGLESEDEEMYSVSGGAEQGSEYPECNESGLSEAGESAADEIDLVLSHSRHEDRLADEKDIPQENLVRMTETLELTLALPCEMEELLAYPQHG